MGAWRQGGEHRPEAAAGEVLHLAAITDSVAQPERGLAGRHETEHGTFVSPPAAFAVLERLAAWFDIEVHKSLRKRNWFFDACNKRVSERFRKFRRRR